MWEGIISLPPPPDPPFNIEILEPEHLPYGWEIPEDHLPPPEEWHTSAVASEGGWDQHDNQEWRNPELPLGDGMTLVFDAEPLPPEEFPVFSVG